MLHELAHEHMDAAAFFCDDLFRHPLRVPYANALEARMALIRFQLDVQKIFKASLAVAIGLKFFFGPRQDEFRQKPKLHHTGDPVMEQLPSVLRPVDINDKATFFHARLLSMCVKNLWKAGDPVKAMEEKKDARHFRS